MLIGLQVEEGYAEVFCHGPSDGGQADLQRQGFVREMKANGQIESAGYWCGARHFAAADRKVVGGPVAFSWWIFQGERNREFHAKTLGYP